MKKILIIAVLTALIAAPGCSKVSIPEISDTSMVSESSEVSVISPEGSDLSSPSGEVSLTNEYSITVREMTTADWQNFQDSENNVTKTFTLTFPGNWLRDTEDSPTFHNSNNDVKVFESITAVKLPAGFDFAGSFSKENFEDSMRETSVVGDIKIGKLTAAGGEKTYAMIVQSVVPDGWGEVRIDRWYPYLYVIVDGNYAYCMQFYSLADPASEDTDAGLFNAIASTFKAVS